jgi:hypothetical protein
MLLVSVEGFLENPASPLDPKKERAMYRLLIWDEEYYPVLKRSKNCALVVPASEIDSALIDFEVGEIVRVCVGDTSDPEEARSSRIVGEFELTSIRRCALDQVTQGEWDQSLFMSGPRVAGKYYEKYYGLKLNRFSPVHVLSFRRCQYDLKALAKLLEHSDLTPLPAPKKKKRSALPE